MIKNKSGIYCLLNIITNKRYVGSTRNLRTRKYDHFKMLRANRHTNYKIQKDFNIYGEKNFEFVLLEFCDSCDILQREQFWMDFLIAYDNKYGYNLSSVAGSNLGYKHNEISIKNMSLAHKGKPNTENQKKKISEKNKIVMLNNINPAKLSVVQVKEMRELSKNGVRNCELSKVFKLDRSQVSRIVNYKAFKHIS